MKIILNKRYGCGFDVSNEAYELYAKKRGLKIYPYYMDYRSHSYKKGTCPFGIIVYFTKDYGEVVDENKIHWDTVFYLNSKHRDDPILVEVVEELGEKASGSCGYLVVFEIPDGINYVMNNYDGVETLCRREK